MDFFHVFHKWNFDVGMFILRSSILVKVSKKIFRMINEWGEGVQISTAVQNS